MGYIYCITNILNQKKYIGKTTKTVEQRFKEHCNDSKRKRCEKRPLYNAMNKYGINNFIVETLKECDNDKLEKYEQYYIKNLILMVILDIMQQKVVMDLFYMIIKK